MATLNIPQNGKAVKGRTQKSLPSVDLTAMVDLAFLLITFFMLTTSLSTMKALDIVKPVPINDNEPRLDYPASRTLTILLGKNNKAVYYLGEAGKAEMKITDMNNIQRYLIENKTAVSKAHSITKEKEMLVIIKPTNTSSYKNFVDIIDEMNIGNIEKYTIDDKAVLEEEQHFMKKNGL